VDGFDFRPDVDLIVTALGWYDHEGDGLIHDHRVGVYETSTKTLAAAEAVVTLSSKLDEETHFRFTTVKPFTLKAGVTYTIVGYGNGPKFDPYVANPAGGVTFAPAVTFIRHRSARATGLDFPTTAGESGLVRALFFGPNFRYMVSARP
jgi:hypothetical protein